AIHVWLYITTALSAAYIIAWTWLSLRSRTAMADPERRLFMAFGAVLVFGVLVNAAICGAISGAFARYQARVAWLLPTLVIVAEMRFGILRAIFDPLWKKLIPGRRADPA